MALSNNLALFGEDFRISRMIYVAKNGNDSSIGTYVDPFQTIQAAIDYIYGSSWYPELSPDNPAIVYVFPGVYTEQLHSTRNIRIQGPTRDGVPAVKSTTLYNTGADSAHYPLRSNDTDTFVINDITIKTDAGGVVGKISTSEFTGVVFQNGHFIESTADQLVFLGLTGCSFKDSMAFNLTGIGSGGMRAMTIIGCYFGDHATHLKLDSFHTTTLVIVKNTIFHNFYPDVGGNWKVEYSNCHSFGTSRTVISTTNRIAFIQCIISNGLHFTADPETNIQLCTFNDDCGYAISGPDITASVVVTNVNYVQNVQQNGISGKIQTVDNVVNVGGDSVNRYYSIQDAIDSLVGGGLIFLQPGTYTEQIHSKANITIQGMTHEGTPAKKSTILYNTGIDAAHYPLRGGDDDYYVINNITIETDIGGVIGKIGTYNFSGCVLSKGYFIEATKNATLFMTFDECTFLDTKAFDLTGVGAGGSRLFTIIDCFFSESSTNAKFDSTHGTTLLIIKNCIGHKFSVDIGGNWKCEFSDCHLFNTQRCNISTTNKVTFLQCIISCGLHFTSNPEAMIQLCSFNDDCGYLITGADITATIPVTNLDYSQNVQQNGISGNIQTLCPIKNVGCHSIDRYITLQDAITSIPASASAVVRIWQDFTGLEKLVLTNVGTGITIDGQRKYELAFTGDIVDITGSQCFGFLSMLKVDGGTIKLSGATAELSLESNQYMIANLVIDSGAFSIIYKTSLFGSTGNPAVTMNSIVTPLIVGYSRVEGAAGQPAAIFTVEADNKFKTKFSTILHGDGGANKPITYTGANKLDYAMYNSALNAGLGSASFNNTIGSPNNTISSEIDF